jgi:beta-xylosidase
MAIDWLERLGVTHVRTGISWADRFRPGAEAWFDRQMQALEPLNITLTLCFTPEHLGRMPHHASPPRRPSDFAEFAVWAVRKYAPARRASEVLVGAESA